MTVGNVMVSERDEREDLARQLPDLETPTIRMQGIVGCSIFRAFHHAPVGSALLAHVQRLALDSGRTVVVAPVGNEGWARKLQRAKGVLIENLLGESKA